MYQRPFRKFGQERLSSLLEDFGWVSILQKIDSVLEFCKSIRVRHSLSLRLLG
jgi:hypothetical protein